mmetsp:Transcript_233/g.360  ORF Transcript_233/g.360 Transcript_233/m.360 type:complete len:475 (+) Transcript_233:142-1566(+)
MECTHHIPFFYIPPSYVNDPLPPFSELSRALDRMKDDIDSKLRIMIKAEDVSRRTEWILWPNDYDDDENTLFSDNLREQIINVAQLLDADFITMENLLKPFKIITGLPYSGHSTSSNEREEYRTKVGSSTTREEQVFEDQINYHESNSIYSSTHDVITHIVRDWSSTGKEARHSIHTWCIHQLEDITLKFQHQKFSGLSILVPGAGMGRLAFDLSKKGYSVEANEISIVMSAVAYRILHCEGRGKFHPYAFDYFTNEVNAAGRSHEINFPDFQWSNETFLIGSLSYTIGDFVEIYASVKREETFMSVVTCFFIDTATNIYEYILVIRNVLKNGGAWINVGPLQWHQNAKLNPSSSELKSIIMAMGFKIKVWHVDRNVINYRSEDGGHIPRYTKSEGYKPLRFVAIREQLTCKKAKNDCRDSKKIINDIRRSLNSRTSHPNQMSKDGTGHMPSSNKDILSGSLNSTSHVVIEQLN